MSTPKLVVVTHSDSVRMANEHFRDFANEYGVPLELEFADAAFAEELPAAIQDLGASFVRVDPDLSTRWLQQTPVQPMPVSFAQAADLFVANGKGGWDPDLLLEKTAHDVIVRQGKTMEINDWAYVIGEGAELRTVAGVCLSLGYRQLKLIGDREDDLTAQQGSLSKLYMGCRIEILPAHTLTLQTVEASLLVNTTDLSVKTDLLNDIAYFNFMKTGGLIADFKTLKTETAVLSEAARAGLRVISAEESTGSLELHLAERLGFGKRIPAKQYLESWSENLKRLSSENRASV